MKLKMVMLLILASIVLMIWTLVEMDILQVGFEPEFRLKSNQWGI